MNLSEVHVWMKGGWPTRVEFRDGDQRMEARVTKVVSTAEFDGNPPRIEVTLFARPVYHEEAE